MREKQIKRAGRVLPILLAVSILFAGCGKEDAATLRVLAAGTSVIDSAATEYEKTLTAADGGKATVTTGILPVALGEDATVEERGAEMLGATGMMKITAMIAAKEIDVVVGDVNSMATLVRGDSFMALSDLFTEEELAKIPEESWLQYDRVGDDGIATGEKTAYCGIKFDAKDGLTATIPGVDLGVFVLGNTENLENAKAYVQSLLL